MKHISITLQLHKKEKAI